MAMQHSDLVLRINKAREILDDLDATLAGLVDSTKDGVAAEGAPIVLVKSTIEKINDEIGKAIEAVTNKPVESDNRRPLPFGKDLERDFLDGVLWMEDTIGLKAYNTMVCMGFETMGTFDPKIRPRRKDGSLVSGAVGLIQFMPETAIKLGTTTAALEKMTRVEQLNYVFKYFNDYRKRGHDLSKWNLGDTYMSILWPAGIGKADDFHVFVRGKGNTYAANHGLDVNKDGIITRGECLVQVRKYERIGLTKLG